MDNKIKGSIKPKTLKQVLEYSERTGLTKAAIVRAAVEKYMQEINNESKKTDESKSR